MNKTLLTTLTLGILFSGVSVFADNDDIKIPSSPSFSRVSTVTEKEETLNSSRYQKVQSRASILVKERINSLNANMKVITADTSLTLDQKTALYTIINTNIAGLTALKMSIASSTDATSTKNLTNSIFTNFRIYGVIIPQIRIEKRIYDLQNHSVKLSDTFIKVQAKIDEYKGRGVDVTIWQKNLDDSKILVANDMYTLANLFTKVSALKPSDYGTTSKSSIEQANSTLKSVLKDFNTIKKNLHKPSNLAFYSKKENVENKKEKKEEKSDDNENAWDDKKYKKENNVSQSVLSGTSWAWVSSVVNGVSANAPIGGKFVLTFGKDNRVHSTTDCNGVGGNYTPGASSSMTFGAFMSTMMFCDGSREAEYSSQLTKTSSYMVTGTTLVLTNSSGSMTFERK